MKTTIRTILGVILMTLLVALYIIFAGYQAMLLVATGEALSVVFGLALWVAPIIGVWSIVRELVFGFQSQQLVDRYSREIGELTIPIIDRRDRVSVDSLRAEPEPPAWPGALQRGLLLDSVGHRREGRASVRRAILLAKVDSPHD